MPPDGRCRAPHPRYPQTVCDELLGHGGPHGGSLVVEGRDIGGAAWGPDGSEPSTPTAGPVCPSEARTPVCESRAGFEAAHGPQAGAEDVRIEVLAALLRDTVRQHAPGDGPVWTRTARALLARYTITERINP